MKVPNWKKNRRIAFFDRKPTRCKNCGRMGVHSLVECLSQRDCDAKPIVIPPSRRLVTLVAAAAMLSSCQLALHESHASATKWEKDTLVTWGGTTHTTGADGFDNATDHNASFQVAAQTGGAAIGGIVGYLTQKSNNILTAMQNKNLTTQQIATLKFQYLTTQAQLAAATKQAAIAAGLTPKS